MANSTASSSGVSVNVQNSAEQYSEFKFSKTEKAFVTAANLSTKSFIKTTTKMAYGKYKVNNVYKRGYTAQGNVDAEKGTDIVYEELGWAATASNMYFKAGWAKNGTQTFASEDELLTYFTKCVSVNWQGKSFSEMLYKGVFWTLYGEKYGPMIRVASRESGGFHADLQYTPISYYAMTTDWSEAKSDGIFKDVKKESYGYQCLNLIDQALREGYSAGVGYASFRADTGEVTADSAVTIVGFTYNEKKKGTANYYTGLILADSDDDWSLSNPAEASNVYKVVAIKWDAQKGTYYFNEKKVTGYCPYKNVETGSRKFYYNYLYLTDFTVIEPNKTVSVSAASETDAELPETAECAALDAGESAEATLSQTRYNEVVKNGETLDISGDKAYGTTVQAGGKLQSGQASYAQDTLIESNGVWNLTDDAAAEAASVSGTVVLDGTSRLAKASIQSKAAVTLYDKATLADSDVWGENQLNVYGGTVSGTVFHSADSILVLDGTKDDGFAQNNTFNGASETLSQYTYSDGDTFNGGTQTVAGGNASNTKLNAGAVQYIDNGYAGGTVIGAGAKSTVANGGCAQDATVEADGVIEVNGSYLDGGTVEYGGKVIFNGESTLNNVLTVAGTLEANGKVSGDVTASSPTILLDLSKRSADDGFMLNDLANFENVAFVISLDSAKKLNTYKIAAQGADTFFEPIYISVNYSEFYEELLPNMSVSYGRYDVNLYVQDDALYLSTTSYLAEELAKKVVSGENATLYTLSQQFQGGDFDEKYQESFQLSMEYDGLYTLTGDFGSMNGMVAVYEGKKKIASGKIKAGELSLQPVLLKKEAQKYTVVVTNTDKGKTAADYTMGFGESEVFDKAYTGDDWTDLKTMGAEGSVFKYGEIVSTGELFTDWVGYGDTVDYTEISFDSATRLVMDISASDSVQYTVSSLQSKTKRDGSVTYSLKTLQSKTVKAGAEVTTKELLLAAGTYYIGVKSTNAAKGGNADYTLAVNENTVFYPYGDNSDDTWQAARDSQTEAFVDGDTIIDWVGYGDSVDYLKFSMAEAGRLSLSFDESTENAIQKKQLKISCVDSQGKKVNLLAFDGESVTSSKALAEGDYYVKFTCADSRKYDTEYEVTFATLA